MRNSGEENERPHRPDVSYRATTIWPSCSWEDWRAIAPKTSRLCMRLAWFTCSCELRMNTRDGATFFDDASPGELSFEAMFVGSQPQEPNNAVLEPDVVRWKFEPNVCDVGFEYGRVPTSNTSTKSDPYGGILSGCIFSEVTWWFASWEAIVWYDRPNVKAVSLSPSNKLSSRRGGKWHFCSTFNVFERSLNNVRLLDASEEESE